MLYKKSHEEFSVSEFRNPDSSYRGAPFWSWNCLITKEIIDEQIQYFKQMRMGGFFIHVRTGFQNPYLGKEFLELVSYCCKKAVQAGLLCWLYDEDRYSSGIAGGEVTKRIAFRARNLRLTRQKSDDLFDSAEEFVYRQDNNEKVRGCLRGIYDIVMKDGYLKTARLIDPREEAKGIKWYLYEELAEETPWCNNQTYVDTMNSKATEYFIEKTHEKYASVLQKEFGSSVPAIFTDEPRITGVKFPDYAEAGEDILLPFTEELPKKFQGLCGLDFYQSVPDIIWNRSDREISPERYYFMEVCCEQFVSSYCKPIGKWCEEHGILFTGHVMAEDNLSGQAGAVGEAMRCYREFQLPGIDNLCDFRQYSTVKQAASAAHQYGREGVLSELYGVTQWDFNFEGYKLAGDWQAALGITTRVPHLAWASMAGEAKRDYPAAIGWQSPWYQDFGYIEEHFARVNYCLTRGVPLVHVGMLHPIETMWLYQGPADQMGTRRDQLERNFQNITEWLLTGGMDFDYISEASLDEISPLQAGSAFVCGKMEYDVILVADCIHLRSTTLKRLLRFLDGGGRVIFCGEQPRYVNCMPSEELERLKSRCEWIPVSEKALLDALEPWRELYIQGNNGKRKNIYLHQFRQEGEDRWLFLAQAYKGIQSRGNDVWSRRLLHAPEHLKIRLKGRWRVNQYDTLTGEIYSLEHWTDDQYTFLKYDMFGDDSLLLYLTHIDGESGVQAGRSLPQGLGKQSYLAEPFGYQNNEPNVLLLDKFEYALDGEAYKPVCELLRMDNILRERLGYPLRSECMEQPYIRNRQDIRDHELHLKITISSVINLSDCLLALEEPEFYTGTWNGQELSMETTGYYVDRALQTVKLPVLKKGENVLNLHMRYGRRASLEWMYLLGEFGVRLQGSYKMCVPKPDRLLWGDYTLQGFPFYTGNMTYFVNLTNEDVGDKVIQVPYYSGAAVKMSVNGEKEQMAAFLPYECSFRHLKKGDNMLSITCLGNRYNGFGQLHMIGDDIVWPGPDSWRTEGSSWTETYRIKPMGILSAPIVKE